MSDARWFRFRFKANGEDPRPVKFPPPGPYWISGYTINKEFEADQAIIIAYIRPDTKLKEFWPDAHDIEEGTAHDKIEFTDRFPKPIWWSDSSGGI